MNESLLYVGIDVHKRDCVIAVYRDYESQMMSIVKKPNQKSAISKYMKKLQEKGSVICTYEAGFSGFALYRQLTDLGIQCIVAAPSMIPRKKGDKIKTDRRDAQLLAKTLRNGDIVAVHVPTLEDEEVRDYMRLRDDFMNDLKSKKQQLLGFLHRQDLKYEGCYWTIAMRKWILSLDLGPIENEIIQEYYVAIIDLEEKLKHFMDKIEEFAKNERYAEKVKKLRAFKGIDTLTALSFVVEIGDFKRFASASQFMSYLGLVPSEKSSGEKRHKGAITKAGNSHLRKLLIESSWTHARSCAYVKSKALIKRRECLSAQVIHYADKAGRRLSKKYRQLVGRGKERNIAVTATAREFSGFIWGMMRDNYDEVVS